jgi:hypothetical protein
MCYLREIYFVLQKQSGLSLPKEKKRNSQICHLLPDHPSDCENDAGGGGWRTSALPSSI